MSRTSFLIVSAVLSIGFLSQSASAKDTDLGKKTASEVKSICDGQGGTYWATPDGNNWGCAKDCGEGTCGIMCDKDTGCLGTTPEGRVSTPADDRVLIGVLNGTMLSDGGSEEDNKEFPWGLLGLLGLAGLFGIKGRVRPNR
jgi:hypothetical protein